MDEILAEEAEVRRWSRRPRAFHKFSDRPLVEMVEFRLDNRVRLGMADPAWAEPRLDRIRRRMAGRPVAADRVW